MNPIVQPDLRYRRLWFGLGLFIAAVIVVLCLLPSSDLPEVGLSDKFEHVLAFAALGFWFASIVVRRDLLWLFLALLLFGGVIEILQGVMQLGRKADVRDLASDGLGILLGMIVALTPLGRWARFVERQLIGSTP